MEAPIKVAIDIDDGLWAKARRLSGIRKRAALVEACLVALIERESARRLSLLGGTEPRLLGTARRRDSRARLRP